MATDLNLVLLPNTNNNLSFLYTEIGKLEKDENIYLAYVSTINNHLVSPPN
jgi:hypothetical protein